MTHVLDCPLASTHAIMTVHTHEVASRTIAVARQALLYKEPPVSFVQYAALEKIRKMYRSIKKIYPTNVKLNRDPKMEGCVSECKGGTVLELVK